MIKIRTMMMIKIRMMMVNMLCIGKKYVKSLLINKIIWFKY